MTKMEYSNNEISLLNVIKSIDLNKLSKRGLIGVTSKLGELRPEVALEILKQFPEFVKLIQNSLPEYKEVLDKILDSDDNSINQVYATLDKGMESASKSRTEFYSFANEIRADLSRLLDDPNLSIEERRIIIENEMDLLKTVSEKDTEVGERENDLINKTAEKDSEKRQLNWRLIGGISIGLIAIVGAGASLLGNDVNLFDKFDS